MHSAWQRPAAAESTLHICLTGRSKRWSSFTGPLTYILHFMDAKAQPYLISIQPIRKYGSYSLQKLACSFQKLLSKCYIPGLTQVLDSGSLHINKIYLLESLH